MDNAYRNMELTGGPLWAWTATECAKRGSAQGVKKPDGVRGTLYLNYFVLKDGSVRWKLVFQETGSHKQTQVAKWVTDWMPPARITRPPKPITTAGRVVTINRGEAGGIERQVRVVLDALGLPYPVPVEVAI